LSPDLYDLDPLHNGIILHSTPPSLESDCENMLSVQLNANFPTVLIRGTDYFTLNGPVGVTVHSVDIESKDGSILIPITPPLLNAPLWDGGTIGVDAGIYYFEVVVELDDGTLRTLQGQFIVQDPI
jgi:hypothetical protein